MEKISYKPIGTIHSEHRKPPGTPIQPAAAEGAVGRAELFPDYAGGLKDLEGFSHIILLYHFHLSGASPLEVRPYMDDKEHGVFAMRGPSRPNPIGMSIVRLVGVEDNTVYLKDVDIVDGTPLLDIKPYVPAFDSKDADRIGWLETNVHKLKKTTDDGGFLQKQRKR